MGEFFLEKEWSSKISIARIHFKIYTKCIHICILKTSDLMEAKFRTSIKVVWKPKIFSACQYLLSYCTVTVSWHSFPSLDAEPSICSTRCYFLILSLPCYSYCHRYSSWHLLTVLDKPINPHITPKVKEEMELYPISTKR